MTLRERATSVGLPRTQNNPPHFVGCLVVRYCCIQERKRPTKYDKLDVMIESEQQTIAKDHEDDFYLMANLFPKRTGLPFVVWVSNRGRARHDVRVKVARGPKAQSSDLISVGIRPFIRVIEGTLDGSDFDLLRRWIELNFDTILQYWNEEIDTGDLMDALRPIV